MAISDESSSLLRYIGKKYRPYWAGFIILCVLSFAAWEIFKSKDQNTNQTTNNGGNNVNGSNNTIDIGGVHIVNYTASHCVYGIYVQAEHPDTTIKNTIKHFPQ